MWPWEDGVQSQRGGQWEGNVRGLARCLPHRALGLRGCMWAGQEAFRTLRAMLHGGQSPRLATSSGA